MNPSLAIANEFLQRAQNKSQHLTHMQLQKLVYLAHGWAMAVSGNPLIEDDIEAWEFGPVIPKLYHALRDYGDGNIPRLIRWGDDTPFASNQGDTARADLDKREREAIEKVWNTYENFHAFQLSALTHAPDSPWSKTYELRINRVIDNYMILDYFADLAASA